MGDGPRTNRFDETAECSRETDSPEERFPEGCNPSQIRMIRQHREMMKAIEARREAERAAKALEPSPDPAEETFPEGCSEVDKRIISRMRQQMRQIARRPPGYVPSPEHFESNISEELAAEVPAFRRINEELQKLREYRNRVSAVRAQREEARAAAAGPSGMQRRPCSPRAAPAATRTPSPEPRTPPPEERAQRPPRRPAGPCAARERYSRSSSPVTPPSRMAGMRRAASEQRERYSRSSSPVPRDQYSRSSPPGAARAPGRTRMQPRRILDAPPPTPPPMPRAPEPFSPPPPPSGRPKRRTFQWECDRVLAQLGGIFTDQWSIGGRSEPQSPGSMPSTPGTDYYDPTSSEEGCSPDRASENNTSNWDTGSPAATSVSSPESGFCTPEFTPPGMSPLPLPEQPSNTFVVLPNMETFSLIIDYVFNNFCEDRRMRLIEIQRVLTCMVQQQGNELQNNIFHLRDLLRRRGRMLPDVRSYIQEVIRTLRELHGMATHRHEPIPIINNLHILCNKPVDPDLSQKNYVYILKMLMMFLEEVVMLCLRETNNNYQLLDKVEDLLGNPENLRDLVHFANSNFDNYFASIDKVRESAGLCQKRIDRFLMLWRTSGCAELNKPFRPDMLRRYPPFPDLTTPELEAGVAPGYPLPMPQVSPPDYRLDQPGPSWQQPVYQPPPQPSPARSQPSHSPGQYQPSPQSIYSPEPCQRSLLINYSPVQYEHSPQQIYSPQHYQPSPQPMPYPSDPCQPSPQPTSPGGPCQPSPQPTYPRGPCQPSPQPFYPPAPSQPSPQPYYPQGPCQPCPQPTYPRGPCQPSPQPSYPQSPSQPSPQPYSPQGPCQPGSVKQPHVGVRGQSPLRPPCPQRVCRSRQSKPQQPISPPNDSSTTPTRPLEQCQPHLQPNYPPQNIQPCRQPTPPPQNVQPSPNPTYPPQNVQPRPQPTYPSQNIQPCPQPTSPPQNVQPRPQPTYPPQNVQPCPQPTSPPQNVQPCPQPTSPPQKVQPCPQPTSPPQNVQPCPQPTSPPQNVQPRPQPTYPPQNVQPCPQPTFENCQPSPQPICLPDQQQYSPQTTQHRQPSPRSTQRHQPSPAATKQSPPEQLRSGPPQKLPVGLQKQSPPRPSSSQRQCRPRGQVRSPKDQNLTTRDGSPGPQPTRSSPGTTQAAEGSGAEGSVQCSPQVVSGLQKGVGELHSGGFNNCPLTERPVCSPQGIQNLVASFDELEGAAFNELKIVSEERENLEQSLRAMEKPDETSKGGNTN